MACLKMVLAHQGKGVIPLVSLGKKCADYGGYTYPLKSSIGLLYKPFVKFVSKEYGFKAKVYNPMVKEDVIKSLAAGKYVIASVTPEIRKPTLKPKLKGGHLILMLGYDLDKRVFYFHNPSGISNATQSYAEINFSNFENYFSHRGIILEA